MDSSRYFALRLVDRASGRHAFVGLGFRCAFGLYLLLSCCALNAMISVMGAVKGVAW